MEEYFNIPENVSYQFIDSSIFEEPCEIFIKCESCNIYVSEVEIGRNNGLCNQCKNN